MFNFHRRSMHAWVKLKTKIKKLNSRVSRFHVNHLRPLNYQQMEREIIEWIDESRANGACLSGKSSIGWLSKFWKRNNLVLRKISSRGRALPANSVDVIRTFIRKANDANVKRSLDQMYNLDETTIYLDSSENYTYEKKGQNVGPIDEYLETNDGENDIDGIDNHCETDDEVNDQDDDEEEISEDGGLDEDEVESSNDSIDGKVESNVEYDTENEPIGKLTSD
ncbi:unnamed protein product [Brachionus calyciflorus]|uniref:HTH CENPB-type domain-containing protein n=1 Tax=Brachionus calyciflorus TaxID=104777 RepID=A0A813UGZ9_9BILA|nr:unnamed protein product [Brachionus calyciflorus]